jgi:acetylornithine deacetylase/succinyl-diaminopimelate desuccinylase family protein
MVPAPDAARMKELLARLVGFASENPPGREGEVAGYLGNVMRRMGFDVQMPEVTHGRFNVVATLDNGGGATLAFNSHLDVVPAGEGWSRDPFRLFERDGRLYGRGACDAKGPITAMVEAMLLLKAVRSSWRGRLIGVFVADEEVGSAGSLAFIADHPPVDRVVVGEPTSLATVSAHKGVLRPRIRISGRSAHSGVPELGENAIIAAARLIKLFVEEDVRLRTIVHPLCGKASLTVTRVEGGIADNVVPASCDVVIDRRVLPGETREQVESEIRAIMERARREEGVVAEIVGFSSTAGACETPASDLAVTLAVEACDQHAVKCSGPLGFMGGCDLVHFAAAAAAALCSGRATSGSLINPMNSFRPMNSLLRQPSTEISCCGCFAPIVARLREALCDNLLGSDDRRPSPFLGSVAPQASLARWQAARKDGVRRSDTALSQLPAARPV